MLKTMQEVALIVHIDTQGPFHVKRRCVHTGVELYHLMSSVLESLYCLFMAGDKIKGLCWSHRSPLRLCFLTGEPFSWVYIR